MDDGREVLRRAEALHREFIEKNRRKLTEKEREKRKRKRKPLSERDLADNHNLSHGYAHGLLFLAKGLSRDEKLAVRRGKLPVAAAMRLGSLTPRRREQVRRKIRKGASRYAEGRRLPPHAEATSRPAEVDHRPHRPQGPRVASEDQVEGQRLQGPREGPQGAPEGDSSAPEVREEGPAVRGRLSDGGITRSDRCHPQALLRPMYTHTTI